MLTLFSISQYSEFKSLQARHNAIADELNRIPKWFSWPSDDADPTGHCRFQLGNWSVFPAYIPHGMRWDTFIRLKPTADPNVLERALSQLPVMFPELTSILQDIRGINWAGFSRLGARSELAPHKHHNPGILICHLGLVIPPDGKAGLMVEDQVHLWQKPGDSVVFDDNHLHTAWNHSKSERIILYINFTPQAGKMASA